MTILHSEEMLRAWRLRHDPRLKGLAQEGWPPPYKRIASIAAFYLAWGLIVFWPLNMLEYVGVVVALLLWLSNPPLLVVVGGLALLLDGQEPLVRYEFGDERDV